MPRMIPPKASCVLRVSHGGFFSVSSCNADSSLWVAEQTQQHAVTVSKILQCRWKRMLMADSRRVHVG
eukprot:m.8458 g.8458  ORF g.8458 m.8458 type:complete len:68 (-) comp6416_c0_seq1:51-254(-)